jgi:carboxymethylenebutenolidase
VATMVTFPTASGDGQGLLTLPRAPGPGVLLLPDFWGLAPDTVAAAQRLARAGCPTLAVEFFHRIPWRFGDLYEQAPTIMLSLDAGALADDINGAAAFLLRHPLVDGGQVCAFGNDGGGALALWAAAICPRVSTVSAAYPDRQLWRAEGIRLRGFTGSHVLLHLADDVTSFRLADAQRLRGELERAGTSVEIFTYPGTRHGFLAGIRPDLFDAAAAELVWARTTALARREATVFTDAERAALELTERAPASPMPPVVSRARPG